MGECGWDEIGGIGLVGFRLHGGETGRWSACRQRPVVDGKLIGCSRARNDQDIQNPGEHASVHVHVGVAKATKLRGFSLFGIHQGGIKLPPFPKHDIDDTQAPRYAHCTTLRPGCGILRENR